MQKRFPLLFFVVLWANASIAQIRVPAIYGDHMVLQQKSDVTIWGWAGVGEELTVFGSWNKEAVKIKASNAAEWKVVLKTPAAGGPFTVTIKGGTELVLKDVLIGEVWICSGQSNMEWSVNNGAEDAKAEMPKATFPDIRLFQVSKSAAESPQIRGEGVWKACDPESMKSFSSVGYFFGKRLHSELKIPIGLINASWGGTPAEAWTPAEKVTADSALDHAAKMLKEVPWCPVRPGVVYNSMIRPLVPFGIAGVIWYQGESNTVFPETYRALMQTLIESWRSDFDKNFPFYYVQIAPYAYDKNNVGVLIREQQSKMLSIPKTGMAVITDVVDDVKNIHPKFKKPVGERLANLALSETYKVGILGCQSPVYKSMTVEKNKIRILFDYAQIGLISHGGDPTQFIIAGEDKKFYPAMAKIDGSSVVVFAKEVKAPVAVRFAWDNVAIPNLFNKEELPVPSFRTDTWDMDMSPISPK
jgi:sialate O-acetylesterase